MTHVWPTAGEPQRDRALLRNTVHPKVCTGHSQRKEQLPSLNPGTTGQAPQAQVLHIQKKPGNVGHVPGCQSHRELNKWGKAQSHS